MGSYPADFAQHEQTPADAHQIPNTATKGINICELNPSHSDSIAHCGNPSPPYQATGQSWEVTQQTSEQHDQMPADALSTPSNATNGTNIGAVNPPTEAIEGNPTTDPSNDNSMVYKPIFPTDSTDMWGKLTIALPATYPHPAVHLQAQTMMQQISIQDADYINTDTPAVTAYSRTDNFPAILIWQLSDPNDKIPKAIGIPVPGRQFFCRFFSVF